MKNKHSTVEKPTLFSDGGAKKRSENYIEDLHSNTPSKNDHFPNVLKFTNRRVFRLIGGMCPCVFTACCD